MSENELPIEAKIEADLTEVANQVYNDTFHKPLNSSCTAIATVIDFFNNTVLYPMQKYNLYAKDKLKNYAVELERRSMQIPTKDLTTPRIKILGPAIEGLKYNLDEEHIKEMFTNILISDMDSKKQSKVLPSYIRIVNELSKDDANFLMLLKEKQYLSSIEVAIKKSNEITPNQIDHHIAYNYKKSGEKVNICIEKLNPLVMDTLSYFNLIKASYNNTYYTDREDEYAQFFKIIEQSYRLKHPLDSFEYHKGLIEFTEFGKNFIEICLS